MNSRTKTSIPFVGLHAHSVAGSPFDALGYPPEHMDFAYDNGMDALALTDHGNMNGLAWQVLHAKKMKKAGIKAKPRKYHKPPRDLSIHTHSKCRVPALAKRKGE